MGRRFEQDALCCIDGKLDISFHCVNTGDAQGAGNRGDVAIGENDGGGAMSEANFRDLLPRLLSQTQFRQHWASSDGEETTATLSAFFSRIYFLSCRQVQYLVRLSAPISSCCREAKPGCVGRWRFLLVNSEQPCRRCRVSQLQQSILSRRPSHDIKDPIYLRA